MKHVLRILSTCALLCGMTCAMAQQVGTTEVADGEYKELLEGWSVKKQFLGATVYNEESAVVGKIDDVIIAPSGKLAYVIIGAGGFVGLGRHDVAVPVAKLKTADNRFVLPGASRDAIKGMPAFDYLPKAERRL